MASYRQNFNTSSHHSAQYVHMEKPSDANGDTDRNQDANYESQQRLVKWSQLIKSSRQHQDSLRRPKASSRNDDTELPQSSLIITHGFRTSISRKVPVVTTQLKRKSHLSDSHKNMVSPSNIIMLIMGGLRIINSSKLSTMDKQFPSAVSMRTGKMELPNDKFAKSPIELEQL